MNKERKIWRCKIHEMNFNLSPCVRDLFCINAVEEPANVYFQHNCEYTSTLRGLRPLHLFVLLQLCAHIYCIL